MADRSAEWARRIQWAAVLVGLLIRLRQYLHARSLWIDEAMLANNILARSFRQLLQPLDADQTAPVPLLWVSKVFAMWFGPGERALRLLPFLGGIVLLIVLRKTAHRLLPPWPAALAVLIVAFSPMLIYYANELKPYGLDAMWATLVLLLALRVRERPGDRRRWLGLLVTGMLATVATTPAPFMLAGAGIGLALDTEVQRSRGGWTWLTACAVLWATVFATVYLVLYKATAQSAYMQHYWVPYFLSPSLPEFETKINRAVGSGLQDWFLSEGGRWRVELGFLLIVPTVVGAVELGSRYGRPVAAMLLIPFWLAVVASTMRRYPVAPRLMLFGMPSMTIMLSAGIWAIGEQLYTRVRLPWFAMAFVGLLALPGLDAVRQWSVPLDRETLRPLVKKIEQDHLPGAAVYVYGRAMPAWLFYTTDWSRPDLTRVHERSVLIGSTGDAFYHDASRGRAVVEEGDSLRFRYRDWRELVGVPAGLGPDTLGIRREAPDPGWAANEARRIRQAGGPEAWLVLFSFVPGVEDSLEAAMQATGARQTLRDERDGAVIERYLFR